MCECVWFSDLVLWIVLSFLDPKLFFSLWVYSEFSDLLSIVPFTALHKLNNLPVLLSKFFFFWGLFFLQLEGSAIFSRLVGGVLCCVFLVFILGLFCFFFLVRICTEFPVVVVVVVRKKVISFSLLLSCLVLFVSE